MDTSRHSVPTRVAVVFGLLVLALAGRGAHVDAGRGPPQPHSGHALAQSVAWTGSFANLVEYPEGHEVGLEPTLDAVG